MNSVHSYERNYSVCNCKDCVQALFLSLCLCISICAVLLFKSKQSVNSHLFTILSLRAGFPCGSRDLPAYLHNMFSSHLLALSKHKLITKQSPKFLLEFIWFLDRLKQQHYSTDFYTSELAWIPQGQNHYISVTSILKEFFHEAGYETHF